MCSGSRRKGGVSRLDNLELLECEIVLMGLDLRLKDTSGGEY